MKRRIAVRMTGGRRVGAKRTEVHYCVSNRIGRCAVYVARVSGRSSRIGGKVMVRIASARLLRGAKNVVRKVDKDPVVRGKGLVKTIARIFMRSSAGKCNVFVRGVLGRRRS